MSSPAEYLRALDRAATPDWHFEGSEYIAAGPRGLRRSRPNGEVIAQFRPSISDLLTHEEELANARTACALRALLPALADVVEAAENITHSESPGPYMNACFALRVACDRLTAAVTDVEGTK